MTLSSLGLVILTGLSGVVCLLLLRTVQTDVRQNKEDLVPHCTSALRMTEALLTLHAQAQELVRSSFVSHSASGEDLNFAATLVKLQGAITDGEDNIRAVGLPLAERLGVLEELRNEHEELKTLSEFSKACGVLKHDLATLDVLAKTNAVAAAAHLEEKIEPTIRKLLPEFNAYQDSVLDEIKEKSLQIDQGVRQTQATMLVSTLGTIALVAVALFFISRSISQPISNLQSAVRRIGKGDQNVSVDVSRPDEIGSLAQAFNEMSKDLHQTTVSKDYVDAIIRSMGDMLAVTDRGGKIRSANPALLQVLGYEEEGLLGMPFAPLLSLLEGTVESVFQESLENGMVHRFDGVLTRKDGATLPVSISVSALRDSENGLNGCVWMAKDISVRKADEAELEKLNKQLLTASRQAGMAEVATSVLHNVGNVLNSVNISASLIADKMKNSKARNLAKVVALLKEHESDIGNYIANDPKGKQLPEYLASLTANLELERENVIRETGSLVSNIVHIKEIVSMQQNYAKALGVTELLKVADLVDDAIRMNGGSMIRHQVKVVREFVDVPEIMTDKHKVLQILINLIRNAKYACDDSERTDKQVTLRIAHEGGRIQISVADNGIGIPPENLTRIFSHGFTTRKEGHGFGLHSGALAAKDIGGKLVVASEGKGLGATFTLELPVKASKLIV